MSNKLEYVDVIVPLSVNDTYQYAIEKSKKIQVGQRVVVQFGIKKQYTAIVVNVTNQKNKELAKSEKDFETLLESERFRKMTQ